jgi:hypothetical protein
MADGFIISPDAVREFNAYHDALPHCAKAGWLRMIAVTAMAAAMDFFMLNALYSFLQGGGKASTAGAAALLGDKSGKNVNPPHNQIN